MATSLQTPWPAWSWYVPSVQAVQDVWPVKPDPDVAPSVELNVALPASQLAQAVCEFGLTVPAAHAVHDLAPVPVNVFVIDPSAQAAQAPSPLVLYWPAGHAVCLTAPVATYEPPLF